MNGRPTLADQCGQFKAINAPGHIDIGEDNTNIRTGFEDPDRICGVSSFCLTSAPMEQIRQIA